MSLYTLYLDDSKWGGNPPNEPKYMVLGGILIEESVEDTLIEKLFKLKKNFKLHPFDPIKFNPRNDRRYISQKNIKDQNKFREKIVSFISSAKITLISAYYDGTKNLSFTEMAFQLINDLSVRFEFFMENCLSKRQSSDKYRGSMILAYPGKDEAFPFSETYYNIRRKTAVLHSKNWSSPSKKPVALILLEPSIYFSFESHNPLIQMADYVAGSVASAVKGKNDIYFNMLKPRFRNIRGNIKGIGLISYPHYTTKIDRLCEK